MHVCEAVTAPGRALLVVWRVAGCMQTSSSSALRPDQAEIALSAEDTREGGLATCKVARAAKGRAVHGHAWVSHISPIHILVPAG
jgi:hypothetical protein